MHETVDSLGRAHIQRLGVTQADHEIWISSTESHVHQRTSGTCGLLIICQALERYVGEQLHLESLAANERCKAAEELSSARAKK